MGSFTADQLRLVRQLAEQRNVAQASAARAITRQPGTSGRWPLSPAQERLYYFDQVDPDSTLYVVAGTLRMRGSVDVEVLRESVQRLVDRHEALRTGFEVGADGGVSQVVFPHADVRLDIRQAGADVDSQIRALCRTPFDLAGPSLIRPVLLRIDDTESMLVLCVHHITVDGWSLGILARELGEIYAALSTGQEPSLPELALRYRDFAVWQLEKSFKPHLDYWRDRLAGADETAIPGDRGSPQGFAGDWVDLDLPAELVRRLQQIADAHQATLFMVLAAGWSVLSSRWSGRADVLFGAAVAGRTRPELEGVVGFFVNTLPLRVQVGGRFDVLLRQVRTTCLEAYAHQDVPFEEIVRELRPGRAESGHSPLARHLLVLHNTPPGAVRLPGVTAEVAAVHTGTAKFDLEIELTPTEDGGLSGFCEYSADLYSRQHAERIMDSWLTVLRGVARDPRASVRTLPLLPPRHLTRLRTFQHGGPEAGSRDVVSWFEDIADSDTVAVVCDATGQQLTYAELDRRANQLAHWLRARGIGLEDAVGVRMERGADLIVSVWGILKAGAVYVPLDPGYPDSRLAGIIVDAAPKLVLTEVPDCAGTPANRPDPLATPENAAYVVFTSGSTGRAKGAVNTRAGLAARVAWVHDRIGLDGTDVVVQKTPIGFDVSVWELVWPLVAGARLVLAAPRRHGEPDYLSDLFVRHGVTLTHFVPSMLRAYLDSGFGGSPRHVLCSGEALTASVAKDFRAAFPETVLHNLYGPTEAAIDVTHHVVESGNTSIGAPVPGVDLLVLDPHGQRAPVGVPGELYIAGIQTARGYVNAPALTAQAFVPHDNGTRLYRTGDRARWTPDGQLDFLGRLDHQVKIRGQRVEPAEVENTLRNHPAVADAAVVVQPDSQGSPQLVAYVIASEDVSAIHEPTGQVNRWMTVFDEIHATSSDDADPAFDTSGWISSYTGEPIPAQEMRAWLDGITARVLAVPHDHVLELGCGTGLPLFAIAPHSKTYHGTDVSAVSLSALCERLGDLTDRVTLTRQSADDFTGIAEHSVDVVLVNSVVQYFPDADYLLSVLSRAVKAVRPGGSIVIGDMRSKTLLETLHTSVQLARTPDHTPIEVLRGTVRQQVDREEELLVDPGLFHRFAREHPEVTEVAILAKESNHPNEMTKFRYDVVISVGAPLLPSGPAFPRMDMIAFDLAATQLLHQDRVRTAGDLRTAASDLRPECPQETEELTNNPLRTARTEALLADCRALVRDWLPDAFMPAHFVSMDHWPVTANGKLDRAALPTPAGRATQAPAYVPPRDVTERAIADIFAESLGMDRVGVLDDFFHLGGHSLLATRVVHRIKAVCRVEVTLGGFLGTRTVAGLAELVRAMPRTAHRKIGRLDRSRFRATGGPR